MRIILIGLSFLLLSLQAVAADDREVRGSIEKEVETAWRAADFVTLERMAAELTQTRAKTPSGKWRLAIYSDALGKQMQIEWPDELSLPGPKPVCGCGTPMPRHYPLADKRWAAVEAQVNAWVAKYPLSAQAHIAKASYLIARARFYRGSGYASAVPREAWPRFRLYIERAHVELESSRKISMQSPVWFEKMFFIASDQAWDAKAYTALVRDFLASGQNYPDAYLATFIRLQPKWGGSMEAMDNFARNAAERTRAEDGAALYSRLYWNISSEYGDSLFTDTRLDWPMMRQGFQDMLTRYPDPRNFNALAKFACVAQDYATVKSAMARIGDNQVSDVWGDSPSSSYLNCRMRAKVDIEMRADPPSWIYQIAAAVRNRIPREIIDTATASRPVTFNVWITPQGEVNRVTLVHSSGYVPYDVAAAKAVREISPLHAPAKGVPMPEVVELQLTPQAQ